MMEMLPFIVFGIAFLALVVWMVVRGRRADAARKERLQALGFVPCPDEAASLVEKVRELVALDRAARRSRASDAARKERLQALGFAPCPDEAESLVEKVTQLENNSEYRYTVERPHRASLRAQPAYYYSKFRHRQGSIVGADELLIPLRRPSPAGLTLFVKPTGVPAGTATKLIGAVATGAWDSQPDDLQKLEIPVDLQHTNLVGILGPSGASLYDLIDPATLSALQHVGDHGALVVMCRGQWCSLAATSPRMPLDLDKLWPLVSGLG